MQKWASLFPQLIQSHGCLCGFIIYNNWSINSQISHHHGHCNPLRNLPQNWATIMNHVSTFMGRLPGGPPINNQELGQTASKNHRRYANSRIGYFDMCFSAQSFPSPSLYNRRRITQTLFAKSKTSVDPVTCNTQGFYASFRSFLFNPSPFYTSNASPFPGNTALLIQYNPRRLRLPYTDSTLCTRQDYFLKDR